MTGIGVIESTAPSRERGNAMVELALTVPLLCVLMLAVFDSGVYVYAFISVQSAARAAAMRNSGGTESAVDQATACTIVTDELRGLPSISTTQTSCASAPLVVSSVLCSGSGSCGSATSSADGQPSTLVTVSYTLPTMFGIPLAGLSVIRISSQMKLRSVE